MHPVYHKNNTKTWWYISIRWLQRQRHLQCFQKSGMNRTRPLYCQLAVSIAQRLHQDRSLMMITQRLRRQRHLRAVFRRVGVRAGPNSAAEAPQLSTLYTYTYTCNNLLQPNGPQLASRGPSALQIYNSAQVRTKALHTNTCNTFLHSTGPQLSREAPQLSTFYIYNTLLHFIGLQFDRGPSALHIYNTAQQLLDWTAVLCLFASFCSWWMGGIRISHQISA